MITSLSPHGDTTTPVRVDINVTCLKMNRTSIKFNSTTINGKNTMLQLDNVDIPSSAQGGGIQIPSNIQPVYFIGQYDLLTHITTQVTLSCQACLIGLTALLRP